MYKLRLFLKEALYPGQPTAEPQSTHTVYFSLHLELTIAPLCPSNLLDRPPSAILAGSSGLKIIKDFCSRKLWYVKYRWCHCFSPQVNCDWSNAILFINIGLSQLSCSCRKGKEKKNTKNYFAGSSPVTKVWESFHKYLKNKTQKNQNKTQLLFPEAS